jgi:hypothetical protein
VIPGRSATGIACGLALAAVFAVHSHADDTGDDGNRLNLPGFSLQAPAGPLWIRVRRDSRSLVWMRRQSDPAHSYSVAVLTGPLPAEAQSGPDFEAWLRRNKLTSPDPGRFVVTDAALGDRDDRTAGCLEYRLRAEDRSGGPVMVLDVAGLACRHPESPDRYFDVQHAERRPRGATGASPRAEGETFVDSFRFEDPPADGNWNLAPGRAPDPAREAT